jgi:hypothetical protein
MGQAALNLPITAAEFLAWEETQPLRHEFVAGDVVAMAGNHELHIVVTLNVAFALRQHLRGSRCRTFATETNLHVRAADAYFYPDVIMTCSPGDAADPLFKREPVLRPLPPRRRRPVGAAPERGAGAGAAGVGRSDADRRSAGGRSAADGRTGRSGNRGLTGR